MGVLARTTAGGWRCCIKRVPQGFFYREGKFHGTKDVVLLLGSAEKRTGVLAAIGLSEFRLDESTACDISGLEEVCAKRAYEELKIDRFAELAEGKKEKLRCGCRGYICLVGDERRLEVYEISDDSK